MRRRILVLAAALAAPVALALPQANAAQLCYDLDVNVEGTPVVVDQAGCLPE